MRSKTSSKLGPFVTNFRRQCINARRNAKRRIQESAKIKMENPNLKTTLQTSMKKEILQRRSITGIFLSFKRIVNSIRSVSDLLSVYFISVMIMQRKLQFIATPPPPPPPPHPAPFRLLNFQIFRSPPPPPHLFSLLAT